MTTTIYRKISPVYGILNEKSAIEGIVKAQRNQEGDTDTVTEYFFLTKIRCCLSCRFSKLPKNGIPSIFRQFTVRPPVYGTLNENKLLRVQQNQEGDTNTVYCHGRPLSGKTYHVVFRFVLVLEDVCSF